MLTCREVAVAAYCPRKLYYRRRAADPDRTPPQSVLDVREVAYRYEGLLADDAALRDAPLEVSPTTFRTRVGSVKARLPAWEAIADPEGRDVHVAGEDCRGVVHKLLPGPSLSLVFAGTPPEQGVWHPQSVRLVAAARALAADREAPVDRVYAEYPAHGVVRPVDLNARRLGAYRAAVRTARSIDGPPSRTRDRAKCETCEFSDRCGVRTRSLSSLLGS